MQPEKRRLLAAPDKFRGTASACEVAAAFCEGAALAGWDARAMPLADGGEGTVQAFGGPNRWSIAANALGAPVEAGWRLDRNLAVIEAASAAGLDLLGGAESNHPVTASTAGVGQLINAALEAGAKTVIVAAGGVATTDGGRGALQTLRRDRLSGVRLLVACDVGIGFYDAASRFAPQKGATEAEVSYLSSRLAELAVRYRHEFGVDVTEIPRAGAAGGLAGGLAAVGAELVSGFALVAERVGFLAALRSADLVVTGEGKVDCTSRAGKVVGEVLAHAVREGVEAGVVAGQVEPGLGIEAIGLAQAFGLAQALEQPIQLCVEATRQLLRQKEERGTWSARAR